MICTVEGCKARAKARGWCTRHYTRWFNSGDPTYVARGVHLPFQPLWNAVRPENVGDLAEQVGFSSRAVARWKHDQGVPMLSADAVACALGMHPSAIWGDGWDGSTYPQARSESVTP